MKKALFAVAAVALLAVVAQAGEIKLHEWPCEPVPQELMTIPVYMDIGYWIRIKDQGKKLIYMHQDSVHVYSGCTGDAKSGGDSKITVETNTAMRFSCDIIPVQKDGVNVVPLDTSIGDRGYDCWVDPTEVGIGNTVVAVCARIRGADLSKVPGGNKKVHVADVKLKVRPISIP